MTELDQFIDFNKTKAIKTIQTYKRMYKKLSEILGGNVSHFSQDKIIELDTNSMKELDILNNPTGVIREAHQLMADAYFADEAFFLVNGTSSGIQTMVMSACNPGDKIILPRNASSVNIEALFKMGNK